MQKVWKHIKWLPVLMTATILAITVFQLYWLKKAYEREKRTLEIRSNMTFRETVHGLQAAKLKLDKINTDSFSKSVRVQYRALPGRNEIDDPKVTALVNALSERAVEANKGKTLIIERNDTNRRRESFSGRRDKLIQFLYELDSPQDSVTVKEIKTVFAERMQQQNMYVPFTVNSFQRERSKERVFNEVTVGFKNPVTYQLQLGNTFPYLVKRITIPVLLSLFLVGFTVVSFSLLYRNLLRQRRLADIKNEFISNITHELKTPIATVSVAIEALRSFNASLDPKKTKEYLDISANELQRLSLLVDKVLKLSMFEKKEVELKYELLNMQDLVKEVTSSMRLQFEKHQAMVNISHEGDTTLQGDRLHLVSVIFNLLDNALKYSNEKSRIGITITGTDSKVSLCVADNGIGVPDEYRKKIFEKFFRVPTGNLHNAKGYGLGLSYVANVAEKHNGEIKVERAESEGSRFILTLPKHKA
ncbi:MAG: sensor histidine kinase [Chitinophagaceae bacterium]